MIDDSIYRELYSIFNRYNPNHIEVDDCNIFHYTSPSALNAILSNHTIRFTDRNYLNDYSEGRYTMELCPKSRFELKLPFKYRDYFKKYCKQLYDPPEEEITYLSMLFLNRARQSFALELLYKK